MPSNLQSVVERYVSDPTDENSRAVAIAALPLVRSLARRISLPDHPLATYSDLENAGMLGMVQALRNYDPERGTPFASFAFGRIRGALVDFLRTVDTLSRDRRRRVATAARTAEEMQQELGFEPRAAQVASRLGVSLSDYDRLRTDARQRFSVSLFDTDNGNRPMPVETLPAPDVEPADLRVETRSMNDFTHALLDRLPERQQRIVHLYFFKGWTLREIAGELHLTEARISQILSKTLDTLRDQMHAHRVAA